MNPEDELLRPVEEHELEEKSKIKKYVWMVVGLFLILLMASFMLTGYSVRSIIAGKTNSEKIEASVINSEYGKILFVEGVYVELKELYHENEKEFKACLIGEYSDEVYLINDLFLPKMHFQDYDKVVSSPCPDNTLLDMHSHPQQHCTFSEQDLKSFQPINENTLLTVMCENDRFIFQK